MEPSQQEQRESRVREDDAGQRLDRVLAAHHADLSRTRIQDLIREGAVRVDGAPCLRQGTRVKTGQLLAVEVRVRARPAHESELELALVYADEDLLVVNKPAGMLVHPTPGLVGGTVAEICEELHGPLPDPEGLGRPGIVHRLDRGTSGLMVLARTLVAYDDLKQRFRARTVEKRYLALVHGDPRFDSGWIEVPVSRSERQSDRFKVVNEGEGREASTYYEVRERFGRHALLEVAPRTGRTHQIRVHLLHERLPIVGDPLYRRRGTPPLPAEAPPLGHQALHAARLAFPHPASGERVEFEAPLPEDFEVLLNWIRGGSDS